MLDALENWLSRRVAILAWSVALLVGGAWMATQVPLEWVPEVELPEVRMTASWPQGGESPRAMERYVTAPLERAAQGVEGTARLRSLSEGGQATVVAEVSEDVDLADYVARLNEELTRVEGELPDRVSPRLTKRVPEELRDEQGFMTVQLVGPQPPGTLRRLAEEEVAPRLTGLAGLADVRVEGGSEEEVLVRLDPDRLATHGIGADVARQRIAEATRDDVYGSLRTGSRSALLFNPAEAESAALEELVVKGSPDGGALVRLGDVATVQRGPAPRQSISRIDGQSVVTLEIDRAPGSHLIDVARRTHERLAELEERLPAEARLIVADDRSEEVRAELDELSWKGGLGLLLVAFVLLMMLRSVRAAAIVLFSVAVALSVALALMSPLGLTLNLITLAGLVIVFGILVDNGVVMTEQLVLWRDRLKARGWSGERLEAEAARLSLRTAWLPLAGGTLTTMAVMVPLVYLSGELRALFLPFGVLVGLTLGASLIAAALLVPVMGRWLPPPEPGARLPRWARQAIQAPYRWAARFPKTTIAVLLLALGLPLWLLPTAIEVDAEDEDAPSARFAEVYNATLGSGAVTDARDWLDPALGGVFRPFIERTDFGDRWDFETRPEVRVSLGFPPGSPITRADSLLQRFEQTALASESVSRTLANISDRQATMRVQFHEEALETAEPYLLRERLIGEATLLAGIQVSVSGLLPQGYVSGVGGGISGFTVEALGPNYEDLRDLAETFGERLEAQSRRVEEVSTSASSGFRGADAREVLRFPWTAGAQARSGATATDIFAHLRPMLTPHTEALRADLDGETSLPVRIMVEGADETDVDVFAGRPLPVTDTSMVKMGAATDYSVEEVPGQIERENQRYKRYITIDYRGPRRMGSEFLEEELGALTTPPGYQIERADRIAFFTDEVQEAFGWLLLGTVALVFLVTAGVFESVRLPLVVMASLPMAAIGVALGFLWADVAFAEGAFIGVVLLTGLAANDAILLVDRYRQLRLGYPARRPDHCARLALRERLRPMWTTTISTIVAMLPLLVFPAEGEFWTGLAVTVTGGLLAATILAPLAAVALLAAWKKAA